MASKTVTRQPDFDFGEKKLFSVPIFKLKRVETVNVSKHPEMTNVANIEFFKINIFSPQDE